MRLRVAMIVGVAWMSSASAQSLPSPTDLAQRVAELEARVQGVESLRAIKRLQYAYGHYVEFGLWDDFADLFAEDAVAHYPAGDLDREAIRALFFDQVGGGHLGLADKRLYPHWVLQPVVTLDPGGTTAHGRWHVLTMLGGYEANATWVDGVYENDYVLDDGAWKISELRTYTVFSGAYDAGWTSPRAPASDSAICENYLINDCSIAFHYRPEQVGAPLGGVVAVDPVDPESLTLSTRMAELNDRIGRLLDEDAVRNLQHSYAYYVDQKRWDDVAGLFAGDATLELGLQGVYRGRASIRRALDQFGPQGLRPGELNDHMQLETIVTIAPDGRTANARGIDFALVGSASPGDSIAEWREAVFENTYVKEGSAWKIATMHLYPRFATDYALGWAKDARPAPVPSEEFPPDAPPTVMHGVYPDFSIPPFHFRNPVTGALPRYPDGVVAAAPPASLPVAAPAGPAGDGVISVDGMSEAIAMAERRVDRALAHDAVENVANAYNFYLDEFAGESARELFAENGSAAVINAGVAGGRESIREAIEAPRRAGAARRPSGFIMIHQTLQPVILVDDAGDHARFRLRLFGSGGRVGEEGAWIAGVYDGEASPQRGGWQLERMDLNLTWAADYSAGWASAAPFAQIASVPLDLD